VTGLDDTKSNKLSVAINPIVAVTIRFSLNYFPNLLSKNVSYRGKSVFLSLVACHLSFVVLMFVIILIVIVIVIVWS